MSNNANTALLERDSEHLIHPLHHRGMHSDGRVWVGGEGGEIAVDPSKVSGAEHALEYDNMSHQIASMLSHPPYLI